MRKTVLGMAGWLCLWAFPAWGQDSGTLPWQEYERLVEKGRNIAPLDVGSLFGDKMDLYSQTLSFSASDVSIPGNNALPVAIGRKLSFYDREKYRASVGAAIQNHDYAFADWDIDIPNVNGVFATTWHDNRCSQATPPDVGSTSTIDADEYWAGNHAELPGGGEMLQADVDRAEPTSGGPFLWVTEGDTYFSCLSSIKNGTGEGFLAITKDGTKYWFDYLAQYFEPPYKTPIASSADSVTYDHTNRRKNVLYATRVEDRFGNWVTYTYTNAYTAPVRLTAVASSDGRSLSLQYNSSGYISSISDGSHTWSYQYSGDNLTKVTLPDGSSWTIGLAALADVTVQYSTEDSRSCFSMETTISGDVTGSITHPSGATATFTIGPDYVGRTNVPGICRNYDPPTTADWTTKDDFPVIPFRSVSLVVKSKSVEGPGLTTGQWTYDFYSSWSWQYPSGQSEPVCNTTTCLDPVCTSDSCAGVRRATITGPDGEWERYTFGNSYRYNEGKLLMHEAGSSASAILKTVLSTYNYATSGQPYPAKIGTSPQSRGAGFVSEYPRPLVETETYQDDALFVWRVDTGCTSSGVYCLDALARPSRVVREATLSTSYTGDDPVLAPSTAPTLTAPTSSSTGSYSLSWTTVSLASTYELQERLGSSGSWDTIQGSSATSASLGGKGSGSWNYQVRACNVAGCSAWSATKVTVVTLPPSGVPTLTAPSSSTLGSYTVSWTSVTTATRYELEERKDGGSWSNIHNAAATSKTLGTQAPGSYDYRVRACNDGGCGNYASTATTTVPQAFSSAPTLSAPSSGTTDTAFTVSWTSISGATQYILERKPSGGSYSVVYNGSSTSTSMTLAVAGAYLFRVKACSNSGCSNYSGTKTVTLSVNTQ